MKSDNTQQQRARIILSAGSKGGVGKSMVSIATIDTLLAAGEDLALVESDTSNPDVFKMYGSTLPHRLMNLDTVDGWMDLVNYADEMKGKTIVVNTAARNNEGIERFGAMLRESLPELDRELVTFWVINRQRDSLELLKAFMGALPESTVHVFRNGYFGDEHKFELYNGSKIRGTIEANGGRSFHFPDLADRVVDDLYSKRLTIETALQDLPIGNRAELKRWRGVAQDVVRGALA
jgi:hypothetical protein